MTPGMYLALARDIGIALALAFLVYNIYGAGENADKAKELKALQVEIQKQAQTLASWQQESSHANAQLQKDLAAISTTPVVVHDWVRNPSCPQPTVLPSAAPKARSEPSDVRAVQPGTGGVLTGDWRDRAVAEFKARWERELANYRTMDESWPK